MKKGCSPEQRKIFKRIGYCPLGNSYEILGSERHWYDFFKIPRAKLEKVIQCSGCGETAEAIFDDPEKNKEAENIIGSNDSNERAKAWKNLTSEG